jgi:hypothetical protein
MDVNEHDKLSNFTAISKQNKDTVLVFTFISILSNANSFKDI